MLYHVASHEFCKKSCNEKNCITSSILSVQVKLFKDGVWYKWY
jgi:hypothetical protein